MNRKGQGELPGVLLGGTVAGLSHGGGGRWRGRGRKHELLEKVGWAVWVVLKTRWCDGQLLSWGWGVWAPRPPLLSPVCPTQFATSQLRLACGGGGDWDNVDTGPWETFPDCFLLASCCLGFSAHLHLAPFFRLS